MERIKNIEHLKGHFGVVGSELLCYPVKINIDSVPSHKEAWKYIKDKSRVSCNYFPRGRVEIRRNKALVFLNECCYNFDGLEKEIRRAFNFGGLEICFKTDNSAHYTNGVFCSE